MTKFEEEVNYLIELSGKVLIGQVDDETFKKNRIAFFEKYETDQQQALPVVPDFIGKLINTFGAPEDGKYINYSASYPVHQKELDWIDNHQKTWLTALLFGFRVEKPQLFYLKNKIKLEDVGSDLIGYLNLFLKNNGYLTGNINCAKKFTQQEIDSMETGSYDLVPVEDGE
ncbi:DUF1642 domain-containing protein [Lactococcus lactis]|uniref:DUF1642 domain-containing protein n=1 Tax=Lactococcus lactis TaxID=1358 RepID=UPI00117B84D7|nr:DUF1642 domain-containing protein [Lactococcus lactis]TRW67982.1 DUF1642 domain-containing protein [Lactococcus lactis]